MKKFDLYFSYGAIKTDDTGESTHNFVVEIFDGDKFIGDVEGKVEYDYKGSEILFEGVNWSEQLPKCVKDAIEEKIEDFVDGHVHGSLPDHIEIEVEDDECETTDSEFPKYRPYIAKGAFFTVEEEDFDKIVQFVDEQTTSYSLRDLCWGEGQYIEFEVSELENTKLPAIGDVGSLGVDFVQVWLDI